MIIRTILTVFALSVIISGCGTGKKLKAAQSEIAALTAKNAELTTSASGLQQQLTDITARDQAIAAELKKYMADCEASKVQLQEVKVMLEEQYASMQKMKDRITEALVDFADKGVFVYYKNGFVYVSMEEGLLYKSGSAALGPKAKSALEPLSKALNEYPDLKIIVLGNTDDKMFKKGEDNWTLSTERANGVIRVLRDDYKIDPKRMTSAGKAKYNPVADNTTSEGRAKNRRTEIILNPDMDKIWQSIQDK